MMDVNETNDHNPTQHVPQDPHIILLAETIYLSILCYFTVDPQMANALNANITQP